MGCPHRTPRVAWSIKRVLGGLATKILPFRTPRVVTGDGSLAEVGKSLKQLGSKKPLIVTSPSQVKNGAVKVCITALDAEGMDHCLFDSVTPDPHSGLVEEGYAVYRKGSCDGIIALGGGSPMDCAKIIGAKVANPKAVPEYEGYLNVTMLGLWGRLPPVIAVPSTAGTGAETTIVAVITLEAERRKIAIADIDLTPRVAILDPRLLVNKPPSVTAATGMDALTHAVESYLSGWKTEFTGQHSLKAVEGVFKHLLASFHDGHNMEARNAMLLASFDAGVAFTRASVGYIHGIAHQLGALFHTPHGVANAMLLPLVLDFYFQGANSEGDEITDKLSELAEAAALTSRKELCDAAAKSSAAARFIARLREMNAEMSVPQHVAQMRCSDVREVAVRALKESHGNAHSYGLKYFLDLGYAVPKYMTLADCEHVVSQVLPPEEQQLWKSSAER